MFFWERDNLPRKVVSQATHDQFPTVNKSGLLLGFFESRRIDAVSQSGRRWTVVENVTEVSVALAAHHFGALHEQTSVRLRCDALRRGGLVKTRPSGARIELCVGVEELVTAAHATVNSRLF